MQILNNVETLNFRINLNSKVWHSKDGCTIRATSCMLKEDTALVTFSQKALKQPWPLWLVRVLSSSHEHAQARCSIAIIVVKTLIIQNTYTVPIRP
jgi:hypothetical protein